MNSNGRLAYRPQNSWRKPLRLPFCATRGILLAFLVFALVGTASTYAQDRVRIQLQTGEIIEAEAADRSSNELPSTSSIDYVAVPTAPAAESESRGWFRLLPTTNWGWFILIFGIVGQGMFTCRFLVQWFASERAKKSIMPTAFWWLSLAGSTMLLTYFIIRQEPIGILGQAIGWPVYSRNLILIARTKKLNAKDQIDNDNNDNNDDATPKPGQ